MFSRSNTQRVNARRFIFIAFGLIIVAALVWIILTGAASSGAAVTIEWSTATELNTAGFNLYRAESDQGPYTRLNTDLIPASPDPLVGGSYAFTDTHVVAGQIYFYQLEDIETSGTANRHAAVQVKAESNLSLYVALSAAALIVIIGAVAMIGRKR